MMKRAKLRPATTSMWHIYLTERSPAEWIGTVEALDADTAIVDAVNLFDVKNPQTLIAVLGR